PVRFAPGHHTFIRGNACRPAPCRVRNRLQHVGFTIARGLAGAYYRRRETDFRRQIVVATMQRSFRNSTNNPTSRRLAWIREAFLQGRPTRSLAVPGSRLMPSSDQDLKPGTLLIAPPMMHDPNFRRTVVLLCEHGPEGSFGLILNRPLAISLHEVMRSVARRETSVSMGGPVQPDTLHFIHCHGDLIPQTIPLLDGIYWGGDFELLKVLIETDQTSPRDLRFFLGYAGWAADQLQGEIDAG